jgi:acyl carrier protein
MDSVEQRIKKIAGSILKIDESSIKQEHSFTADLGADSTQSIELVAAFEEEFDIVMDEDEALSCDTVAKGIDYITRVCKKQGRNI